MTELTPITLPRLKCDYCNHRVFHSKPACIKHEDKCYKNPNRNCPTCENDGEIEYYGAEMTDCPDCAVALTLGGKSFIPSKQTIINPTNPS